MSVGENTDLRTLSFFEWLQISKHALDRIARHNLSLISAGVAFFAMLALFPAIAATISIYSYFADPVAVQTNLELLRPVLPDDVFQIINRQVTSLISTTSSAHKITSILSILLAIWSARAAMTATITGLNIVYRIDKRRGLIRRLFVAYLLTFILIVVGMISIGSVVVIPTFASYFPLGIWSNWAVQLLNWFISLGTILLGIGILYRFGPNVKTKRTGWISVGSIVASVLWITVSVLFSYYMSNFSHYNQVYGSLGAVVALLIWFYLSAWVIFLGAELNAEIAHHRANGPGPHNIEELQS